MSGHEGASSDWEATRELYRRKSVEALRVATNNLEVAMRSLELLEEYSVDCPDDVELVKWAWSKASSAEVSVAVMAVAGSFSV